jgi:O-antigen/teichoic acid export membrane protein
MKAAISTILYHSYRNLDFVIVGRAFGVATLGAFRVAFDVAMIPQMAILDVVNRTVFPIYSRIGVGDRPRLKALFLRMTRDTSLVSGTLAVMLYFFGSDILWLVSGGKWASAGPMIRVLCWAAFLRTLTQAIPQVFHAAGRPELAAYDSLLTLVCFLGMGIGWVVLLGPSWGANAVSLAWVTTYVLTLTVLRAMARRVIGVSVLEYAKNLAHPLGLMAILFIALLGVRAAGAMMGNPLLATAFGVFSGCAIVMAYLRVALGVTLGDLLGKNVKAPES